MEDADDALDAIYSQDVIAERKALGQTAYEERIIKKILTRLNLDKEAGKLAQRAKELTGKARLTFEWFYEEYPDFPVYLRMRKVPFAFKVGMPDLFNKFCSTPMFKEWESFRDEAPVEDKALGLLFDWPGVEGTQMVLHDWLLGASITPEDNALRLIRTIGSARKRTVIIEQFEPFFERVVRLWSPGVF